jgi:ribosomal protein S27AE
MEKGTTVERKPCPRCGDEYANIPNHLRHCDGESDD